MRQMALRRIRFAVIAFALSAAGRAQTAPYERTFHQPKPAVEKALQQLQNAMSGRLPILEGFASGSGPSLDRYQRGYFQSTAQVTQTPSGCVVRVTTKLTAWYSDPNPARSGYRVLTSNGRLENDLLDQLAERLVSPDVANGPAPKAGPAKQPGESLPSAPLPNAPAREAPFTSSRSATSTSALQTNDVTNDTDHDPPDLRAEAASLEEALKNIARPKNIVAVKKSGTPVVATPSISAKPLFMASMHDEFEMLDFSHDWVHVRISGLSRGWIWRDSLEMPDDVADNPQASMGPPPAADLFQVSREETGSFPGDWEPLRGRSVKIVSVQKINETSKDAGPQAKLEYAKYLLDKNYAELARKSKDLSGIVLIFDSADGGMVAATSVSVERWRAGTLSDAALWHQCFFDPPETFAVVGAAASR